MDELMLRSSRMFALRGAIAVLLGLVALFLPGLTLLWLVAMFAVYALLMGTMSVITAIQSRKRDRDWWLLLLLGLVSVCAGIAALVNPGLAAMALVMMMGATVLVTGALDIAIAIRMHKLVQGEWLLALSGLTAIVFGVLVFLFPDAGGLAMAWLISFYALVTGFLFLAASHRLRKRARDGLRKRGNRQVRHG